MSIAVCTDSSALVPPRAAERLAIAIVPITVSLDGEPLDDRAIGVDDFYERLASGAKATTSQPSPGEFAAAYSAAAAAGDCEILSLHADRRLSGTVASAELGASAAPVPVTVLDTGTVSFGVAVCACAAAELLASGGTSAEAKTLVRGLAPRVRNVFVAAAAPRGRLAATTGWNVLELTAGNLQELASCADPGEAANVMAARIGEDGQVQAAVGHAARAVESAADGLAAALEHVPGVVAVERYRVGPAVGAHTGPLSFGAFWWPSSRGGT